LRGLLFGNREPIQHLDNIVRSVLGFPGNPAVGRKQLYGLTVKVNGDCDQVADLIPRSALERRRWRRQRREIRDGKLGKQQWRDPDGHTFGTQKSVKMAPLGGWLAARRMCMEKVLGMADRVVDLSLGIMPPCRNRC